MLDAQRQVLLMFMLGLVGGYLYAIRAVEEEVKGSPEQEADTTNCKMVFVIRNDLGLTRGKLAEQCAQACLSCYEIAVARTPKQLRAWKKQGQAKITLKCKGGQDEMLILQRKAEYLGLVSRLVVDPNGGVSVLGIGPAGSASVNMVTGELGLF